MMLRAADYKNTEYELVNISRHAARLYASAFVACLMSTLVCRYDDSAAIERRHATAPPCRFRFICHYAIAC